MIFNFVHITTPTLADGTINSAYSQTLSTINSQGQLSFSLHSGNLPAGVNLNSSTGTISGTPTQSGMFAFTVRASDTITTGTFYEDKAYTINIAKLTSTTAIISSKNPSLVNQSITFTATITGSSGTPTGTVTFKDGASTLNTINVDATGHAQYQTSALALGNHNITAVYNGNNIYNPSSSSILSQSIVQKFTPTISLLSYPNPSQVGQSASFYGVVASSGNPTPTGNVTFKDGNTVLGTGNLNAAGQTVISTSTLTIGNHSITATYNGNATYFPVTSSVLIQVVN